MGAGTGNILWNAQLVCILDECQNCYILAIVKQHAGCSETLAFTSSILPIIMELVPTAGEYQSQNCYHAWQLLSRILAILTG